MTLAIISDGTKRAPNELDALAEAAANGDSDAVAQLLKKLAPRMIRAAHAVMGVNHADVDDVIQQSLIALVQALPAFRGECSASHYALRIVARIAVAAKYRSRVRGDRRDDSVELELLESAKGPQSDEIDAERRRAVVRELLETLPEEQAETLVLRIAMGFSLAEVAASTGVPLNTVRSRIRLAKTALRTRIERRPELGDLLEVDS